MLKIDGKLNVGNSSQHLASHSSSYKDKIKRQWKGPILMEIVTAWMNEVYGLEISHKWTHSAATLPRYVSGTAMVQVFC